MTIFAKKESIKCSHEHWEIRPKTRLCCVDCLDCHKSITFAELFGDKPFMTSEIFKKCVKSK